jgi:hypothetical protein
VADSGVELLQPSHVARFCVQTTCLSTVQKSLSSLNTQEETKHMDSWQKDFKASSERMLTSSWLAV